MTEMLDLEAVAARLGGSRPLSTKTIQRLIRRGDLKSIKIGRCRRVIAADLEDFIQKKRA